jgi:hypothetical protein
MQCIHAKPENNILLVGGKVMLLSAAGTYLLCSSKIPEILSNS